MGLCCFRSTDTSKLLYVETVSIRIKERERMGRSPRPRTYTIQMNYPIQCQYDSFFLSNEAYSIQGSIIPGQDPRSQYPKECQDLYFYTFSSDCLLVGLFDGHGSEGARVVSFCVSFMKDFFESKQSMFESSPLEAIQAMINDCDEAIRSRGSKIDTNLSGTTAVVIYMNQTDVYLGNVGDSRAVLGTSAVINSSSKEEIEPSRSRQSDLKNNLNTLQMTADHKPNHAEELKRIRRAGGSVQQLTDCRGRRVGPYRVWKQNGTLPGLAMSRSIGDHYSKNLGVTAEASTYEYPIVPLEDQFIIIASDGLWDVMSNFEAVNFVENFRKRTKKKCSPNMSYPVRPENTIIAHLLAEEARYRWLGICEEEDVMIDDISIVIIELNSGPLSVRQNPSMHRASPVTNSLKDLRGTELKIPSNERDDPIRLSYAPALNGTPFSVDPVRSSMGAIKQPDDVDLLIDGEMN